MGASVLDCLVGRAPEIEIDSRSVWGIPDALCHKDRDHGPFGIEIRGRSVPTVPAEPSGNSRHVIATRDDGQAEALSAVVPKPRKKPRSICIPGQGRVERRLVAMRPQRLTCCHRRSVGEALDDDACAFGRTGERGTKWK